MTNENVNCSLLITIHCPDLVLFKKFQSYFYLNLTHVIKCLALHVISLWGVLLWRFFTSWRSVIQTGNIDSHTSVWGSKPKCHHARYCSGAEQQKILSNCALSALWFNGDTGLDVNSGHLGYCWNQWKECLQHMASFWFDQNWYFVNHFISITIFHSQYTLKDKI